jgi:hypothetical protein
MVLIPGLALKTAYYPSLNVNASTGKNVLGKPL